MKVITIKQPFASLIAAGIKEYEFRTWRTKYREEILIHAGKGIDKKAMKKFECFGLDYPTGCIIAQVNLVDCIPIDSNMRAQLQEKNEFVYSSMIHHTEWQGYGFQLAQVKKVKPIQVNGKLSLWDFDGKVEIESD